MRLAKAVRGFVGVGTPVRVVIVALFCMLAACTTSENEDELAVAPHHAPTITTSKASYLPNENITLNWSEMPGNPQDWVAINTAGSPPTSGFQRYQFINGQVMGSVTFAGLPAGTYEARAYANNTYTIIASQTFTVSANTSVTVTTDKSVYPANPTITVSWQNMPGNQLDWVAINVAGSAPYSGFVQWKYIGGVVNGSTTFSGGIPPGNYEARMYLNNDYTILTSVPFTVVGTTISTTKTVYTTSEDVIVNFAGMPGNPGDYISINTAGSPANGGFITQSSTGGAVSGTKNFNGLAPGQYEARAYLNNSFTLLASVPFSVTAANISITTDKSAYAANESVTVSWTGLPGSQTDWIAISTAGSPDNAGAVAWVYTNGQSSGMTTFANVPAGTYQARAYLNNSYTVAARSALFSVAGAGMTCTSSQTRPVFESLTTGELSISGMAQETSVPLTVPLDRSILFISMRANEPSPAFGGVMCQLHEAIPMGAAAGITCSKNNPGTDFSGSTGTVTVRYTVVTFTSGVTVQRGLANTGFTNPTNATISSVTPGSSFVVLGGIYNGGTGWGNNEFVRATLTSGTNLELSTTAAGTQVPWQVVTMTGATVQRGTTTIASGDTTASVTISNAPSGSIALASYTTDNASGIAAASMMLQTRLLSPTSLELRRAAGGAALSVSWEVVSLPFATLSGTATFGVGATSASSAIGGHSAAASVALSGSQAINGQASGSTTYAGADLDIVGEAQATMSVGTGSVDLTRAASQATAEIPWQVIDFSRDCTGL